MQKSVVLIIGREEDPCCAYVRNKLAAQGKRALFLPEDKLFPGMKFDWIVDQGSDYGSVEFGEFRVEFDQIESVLARFYGVPFSADKFSTSDGQYVSAEWHAQVLAWMSAMPCKVVNRVSPELWYKTSLSISDIHAFLPCLKLPTPRMLTTTDTAAAKEFFDSCNRDVIYSPLTQLTPYPVQDDLTLEKISRLAGTLPLQLTERTHGERVDVFMIDGTALTFKDGAEYFTPLCAQVRADCRKIAEGLGLAFCRISITLDQSGEACYDRIERMPHLYDLHPDAIEKIATCLVESLTCTERGSSR